MKLTRFSFHERTGKPGDWQLEDMTLGDINLIVGRNASGKSRTISILWNLAARLSGLAKEGGLGGHYSLDFSENNDELSYNLEFSGSNIVSEKLTINNEVKLERHAGGIGRIYAEEEGKFLNFQAPEDQIAAVNRQDSIQHKYLFRLTDWAKGVFFLPFGTPLGRDHLVVFQEGAPDVNPRDPNQATGIFRRAIKEYGESFKQQIIEDMKSIGYNLTDVGIVFSDIVKLDPALSKVSCLFVKEDGIEALIEQAHISQGMFRALSSIIQINYGIRSGQSSCLMIDDIGEGLDFSRSCDLIQLLIDRVSGTNLQLIASTNDRFVMNNVDLKYWIILDRKGSAVRPLSYRNSKEVFDDFKFTGLSNFDFLSRDFFREANP